MYVYFTAFNIQYAWWGVHLLRSVHINSPNSNFKVFLILSPKDVGSKTVNELVKIISLSNPSAEVLIVVDEKNRDAEELARLCAGYRTFLFGPKRKETFDDNVTAVWIDADSIVRGDLSELESFCEKNDFDISARAKNTKFKFASGLVIQKGTQAGKDFGQKWHENWIKRFKKSEWTADQNAFNETTNWLTSRSKGDVVGAPKSFCDVWLSETGLIWQAKHQTKMKKSYVDEMRKYEPQITLDTWDKIKNSQIRVSIDTTSFRYRGLDFEFMGLEEEETFEFIKSNNTFYNLSYLEAIASLGNEDAHIIVGAGIQNDNVYLSAFNNSLASINFEPNVKMIDIGLRNSQNNPGSKRNMLTDTPLTEACKKAGMIKNSLTMYLNWKTASGQEVAAIAPITGEPLRTINNQKRYGVCPDDLDFSSTAFLKNGKYKKVRKLKYLPDTKEMLDKYTLYSESIKPEIAVISLSAELDEIVACIHKEISHTVHHSRIHNILTPFSPGQPRANYNLNKFVGLLVIDVPDLALSTIRTGIQTLKFFYPHVAVTVYDELEQEETIKAIEDLLGPDYEKIYNEPPPLDPGARSIVFKSLRRS